MTVFGGEERGKDMEHIKFFKDVKKREIKKGEEFVVKRDIYGTCVVCTGENRMNWITTASVLKRYGNLTGEPKLCFS